MRAVTEASFKSRQMVQHCVSHLVENVGGAKQKGADK